MALSLSIGQTNDANVRPYFHYTLYCYFLLRSSYIYHILRALINLQTKLGIPQASETKTAPKTGRTQITDRIYLYDLVDEAKICENPQMSREQLLPNR